MWRTRRAVDVRAWGGAASAPAPHDRRHDVAGCRGDEAGEARLANLRFPALVEAYQEDVRAGRQAGDWMERHRAPQRILNRYHVEHLRGFFADPPRPLTLVDSRPMPEQGRVSQGAGVTVLSGEAR